VINGESFLGHVIVVRLSPCRIVSWSIGNASVWENYLVKKQQTIYSGIEVRLDVPVSLEILLLIHKDYGYKGYIYMAFS
jgi:hypothetical protein